MDEAGLALVERARTYDDSAFAELMDHVKTMLYRIAYMHLKNEHDALDALQETTYRAYKAIRKLREPHLFRTWVTRIMLHVCMDELKRQSRGFRKKIDMQVNLQMTSGHTQLDQHDAIDLHMAIDRLKPQSKQIVILKYLEDLTIVQIAGLLDQPEGTTKTHLHKALTELRTIMGKEGEIDERNQTGTASIPRNSQSI
ncbi:sigma-70 family RNA polymerase sigma factor [Paenibacillus sp. N1-5-1-14]|uniref:sigma-70 family RNA polymerase sigma factor n=1 Tax=Paenibacillus radicibacter TaxID=2972488 RepID=UPI0021598B91|nr:sigma-70 family RNA polymerase sigma factor [Paenibacillus radicibacter]MCR8644970.1 sigma-70 family RNA polymerase sigma factor [Paenibacillus radicibacter]